MSLTDSYPNFKYKAKQLRKYLGASSVVTLLLTDGRIVHFTPEDITDFLKWLSTHNVENIGDAQI